MSTTPSWAVLRNEAVRAALRQALPGTRFNVRNGPQRTARIRWTDGPTRDQVAATLQQAGLHWTVLDRNVSAELIAVAYLRADAAGNRTFYSERHRDNTPVRRGDTSDPRAVGSCEDIWHQVPQDSVTSQEWSRARALLALGDVRPSDDPLDMGQQVGHLVYHFAHVLDAVLAE